MTTKSFKLQRTAKFCSERRIDEVSGSNKNGQRDAGDDASIFLRLLSAEDLHIDSNFHKLSVIRLL